jgi:N-acetylated-alpha-linked acidic dipeptidase
VHMNLQFDWKLVPARDVIARLPGTDLANEWVMHGNHSDAWVNGADDPISGLVAELEEARAIGELSKSGWKPRRTMVFAAWDGEEQGLLGSTEWVEAHTDELRQHLAVYINSDSNGRGFLDAGGSHSLERFVTEVARDVTDPEKNVSVLDRLRARQVVAATEPEKRKEWREREAIRLDALGSGSDFTPFLQHAGIAALNIGYSGEGESGSYHSIYDSFDHYTRFVDPGFTYGIVQAKTTGRMMLRLANADVLPFEYGSVADTIRMYVTEVMKLADDTRTKIVEQNLQARDRAGDLASDPTKPYIAPKMQEAVPYLDFSPLQNAVARLDAAAKHLPADVPDSVSMRIEQLFTREEGLPRRPWFKHQIYAPGFYTGYGVKTLPGVREAIEQKNWTEANQQIGIVAKVIERYAAELEKLAV